MFKNLNFKNSLKIKNFKLKIFLLLLPFVYLLILLAHPDQSFTQDLGRHIKTGEMILSCHCVPKINLFSFTQPSHIFINHHWLSEVVFYLMYTFLGVYSFLILKVILIFAAFGIVYWLALKKNKFWGIVFSIPYIFMFSERFDVRPELFSFLFISFFIFLIQKFRESRDLRLLYPLPLIELFWVNMHIYFIVGIVFLVFLMIEEIIQRKNIKFIAVITFITVIATLLNPSGIIGALQPFTILQNYGYSIEENQNIFFLNTFFFNPHILIFEILAVVAGVLSLFKLKLKHIFPILVIAFSIYEGANMIRNFPIFVLATFPFVVIFANEVFKRIPAQNIKLIKIIIFITVIALGDATTLSAISSPAFGFSYEYGAQRAVDFFKRAHLKGSVFNNFDIGSYLIFRLYPAEKVFVDGRPEAYSVKFFDDYKRMQTDQAFFKDQADKYDINTIFFEGSDATPWAQTFLSWIIKDPDWVTVYLDQRVIILVKNIPENKGIIQKYRKTI